METDVARNQGKADAATCTAGASARGRDIHGMTALFYAVDGEFSNVVRTLVRAGALIDEVDSDNQYTPLIRLETMLTLPKFYCNMEPTGD
ncbi:unnamed protein product [Dibothriocephalus latus]|uniref:Uncharacterized protein n=1 Tax=Dibothriocephalus latus TaxID=60516 RepID=A0A3P7QIE8_DIBLA|nr:unnamed protein product [Dibothriocephalus latus]